MDAPSGFAGDVVAFGVPVCAGEAALGWDVGAAGTAGVLEAACLGALLGMACLGDLAGLAAGAPGSPDPAGLVGSACLAGSAVDPTGSAGRTTVPSGETTGAVTAMVSLDSESDSELAAPLA